MGGSALTPGPSAVLDTAALTAQLSRLDAASLEAIRGYASGYIDGRVQAMPQYGQVRADGGDEPTATDTEIEDASVGRHWRCWMGLMHERRVWSFEPLCSA